VQPVQPATAHLPDRSSCQLLLPPQPCRENSSQQGWLGLLLLPASPITSCTVPHMLQATLLVYTLGWTVEMPVMTPYRCTVCTGCLLLGLGLLAALLLVCVKVLLEE
jgi:hypothetical protein